MVAFCAEFPNDNPALHDGAIFVVTTVYGATAIELPERPRPLAPATSAAPEQDVVDEPTPALVRSIVASLEPVLGEDEEAPRFAPELFVEDDGLLQALTEPVVAAEPEESIIAAKPEESIVAAEPEESIVAIEPELVAAEPEPVVAPEPEESIAVSDWEEEWRPEELQLEGSIPAPAESAVVLAAPAESAVVLAASALEAGDEPIVVEPIEAFEPAEVYASSELHPESDDPFHVFVVTVADACVAAGELAVAAALPSLLFTGQIAEGRADDQAMSALVDAGWLEREEGGYRVREPLRSEALGWQAILRGTSDDFGACGPLPLDEWSARLVAGLCAKPEKETVFRRELRSRGVAAFGLAA